MGHELRFFFFVNTSFRILWGHIICSFIKTSIVFNWILRLSMFVMFNVFQGSKNCIMIMDQIFVRRVLVWVLFLITLVIHYVIFCYVNHKLENCYISSLFFLEPILWALSKKKHSFQMFWIELKQILIHWQMVEAIVWHTTLERWKIQKIDAL